MKSSGKGPSLYFWCCLDTCTIFDTAFKLHYNVTHTKQLISQQYCRAQVFASLFTESNM